MLKKGFVLLLLCSSSVFAGLDNYHFYQANRFWGEPHFERPWLSSFNVFVGGGHATLSRNSCGEKTPLFNMYGPFDLQHLAQGVPLDPQNPIDLLLLELNELPNNDGFGKVLYGGDVSFHTAIFDICQNFRYGLYVHAELPVRSFHIHPNMLRDLSPTSGFPNAQNPLWRELLINLNPILKKFDLTTAPHHKRWFGDLNIALGWAKNYQETEYLDFVDFSCEAGFLFPTCKALDPHYVFDLSTGNNHHWGGGIIGQTSIGMWEWLTIGGSSGALFLADRTAVQHVFTGTEQNGLIKLAQAEVNDVPGIRWHVSTFIKGDHFSEVFSFILGYSYNRKERDRAHIESPLAVSDKGVNEDACEKPGIALLHKDQAFAPWDRHTIHVQFELDFAKEQRLWHPHVYFSYDHPVGGHRIFQLSVGGATFGMDLTW